MIYIAISIGYETWGNLGNLNLNLFKFIFFLREKDIGRTGRVSISRARNQHAGRKRDRLPRGSAVPLRTVIKVPEVTPGFRKFTLSMSLIAGNLTFYRFSEAGKGSRYRSEKFPQLPYSKSPSVRSARSESNRLSLPPPLHSKPMGWHLFAPCLTRDPCKTFPIPTMW